MHILHPFIDYHGLRRPHLPGVKMKALWFKFIVDIRIHTCRVYCATSMVPSSVLPAPHSSAINLQRWFAGSSRICAIRIPGSVVSDVTCGCAVTHHSCAVRYCSWCQLIQHNAGAAALLERKFFMLSHTHTVITRVTPRRVLMLYSIITSPSCSLLPRACLPSSCAPAAYLDVAFICCY